MDTLKKSDDEENKGCNETDPIQNEEAEVETTNLSHPFVSPTMAIKRWSDVPDSLMKLIADEMSFKGYINLIKSSARFIQLECNKRDIFSFSRSGFWTLVYDIDGSSFLYSSRCERPIRLKIEELEGATVLFSKGHWLLVQKNAKSLSLLNVFSTKTIRLPEINLPPEGEGQYFVKSLPDKEGEDCVVWVSGPAIQSCNLSETERVWREEEEIGGEPVLYESFSYSWKKATLRKHRQNWLETFAMGLHLKMKESTLFVEGNGMGYGPLTRVIKREELNTEEYRTVKAAFLKPFEFK